MKLTLRLAIVAAAITCAVSSIADQQGADVVDSDQIADALNAPKTRSLTRGIGVRQKARVDLKIPFEVNSSELKPEARQQLRQLVDALSRDSLAEFRFQIAGHTDASGASDYNLDLSERRAQVVMQYLVDNGVARDRLVAIGYGEEKPLRTGNPEHSDNRRVEIINIGTASRH